jgi:hypothetical protein
VVGVVREGRVVAVADAEVLPQAVREAVAAAAVEPVVQLGDEREGVGGEDVRVVCCVRTRQLDGRGVDEKSQDRGPLLSPGR